MAEAEAKMKQFNGGGGGAGLDAERGRFPYCVVWTPIPVLTWLFPIIGHMGICTSTGVIRDFAGPYFVSEDNMAFGKPVKYWKLDPSKVYSTSPNAWDTAVHDASEEYKHRMHNLCCDNCHSHVALALNLMRYDNSTSWNMVKLCFFSLLYGKYVRSGFRMETFRAAANEPRSRLERWLPRRESGALPKSWLNSRPASSAGDGGWLRASERNTANRRARPKAEGTAEPARTSALDTQSRLYSHNEGWCPHRSGAGRGGWAGGIYCFPALR
ncbi:transmembrane protein 222 isoform X1 [Mycteria americana]|uniref:transmembrane protein 222 isoform X1 n=2 Tax=Mycteria americana TaxID=33587 RepID=UPI003F58D26F